MSPYIDSTSFPIWKPFFIRLKAVEAVARAVTGSTIIPAVIVSAT
jgi:hypothetical protein